MHSPRLIALDIDGTLFAPDQGSMVVHEVLTPRVQAAIARAEAAGAHIVLATGRSSYGVTRVWDALELPDRGVPRLTVASNGSVLFTYPPVEVIATETFDASRVVRELLEHVPSAAVAVEEIGVGYRVNREFPSGEITGQMLLQSVDELVAEPVTRVIIRDPDSSAEQFIELASRLGLHGTNYYIGWTAWLDLSPIGISKASGLAQVAQRLGVKQHEVLALGDGRNDVEMLQWAGRGVAMGQAVDEVKAAADAVTASVFEEGVAVELERWFPA